MECRSCSERYNLVKVVRFVVLNAFVSLFDFISSVFFPYSVISSSLVMQLLVNAEVNPRRETSSEDYLIREWFSYAVV